MRHCKECRECSVVGHLVVAMFAMSIACFGVAQETAGWAGAKVTKTDLTTGETNYGRSGYFQASVMTRAGCHVARVEGERGKECSCAGTASEAKPTRILPISCSAPTGVRLAMPYAETVAGASHQRPGGSDIR